MWPFERREEGQSQINWLWNQLALGLGFLLVSFYAISFIAMLFEDDDSSRAPVFVPAGSGYTDSEYDEGLDCYTDWDGRNNPTVCE